VLAAVKNEGDALQYVDKKAPWWNDKDMVLQMVALNGDAVKYAADSLFSDKQFIIELVKIKGEWLKYAKDGLNQDLDCLKAAGLFDEDGNKDYARTEKVTLSVKFSLAAQSSAYATTFAKLMKSDAFLTQFKTYNPNAWCKKSCDPKFTNMQHPCRGTSQTCGFPDTQNLDTNNGRPCKDSCWRFAFRFHQQESKDTGGFMIQVEEEQGLGDGQKIETEMAREAGLKVFRTYTNYGCGPEMKCISKAVEDWYKSGCANQDLENVFIGQNGFGYDNRPQYEPL